MSASLPPTKPMFVCAKASTSSRERSPNKDGEIINRNFELLVEELLEAGSYVGIATHDERLVWSGFEIIERLGLAPERYEFQMLLGVDEELRRIICDAGHRLRVYVPFGIKWHAYSVRRLRENPAIVGHVRTCSRVHDRHP